MISLHNFLTSWKVVEHSSMTKFVAGPEGTHPFASNPSANVVPMLVKNKFSSSADFPGSIWDPLNLSYPYPYWFQ